MYLEKVRAKGTYYLYLKEYDGRITYGTKKRTLYRFGRLEKARRDLLEWRKDINKLPEELKEYGCTRDDVERWTMQVYPRKPAGFSAVT